MTSATAPYRQKAVLERLGSLGENEIKEYVERIRSF